MAKSKKNKQSTQSTQSDSQSTENKLPVGSKPVERKRTFDTGPTDSRGMVPKSAKKDK